MQILVLPWGFPGTDVAKNAADMILTDDNFITITKAVKEGRRIYSNIQKAVRFLISTNVGEIVSILFALLLGLKSPLLAIHLLWINLVTDSLPAIALGLEKAEKNIMKKPPINSKKGLFSDGLWKKIFIEGSIIGLLDLLLFYIGIKYYDLKTARTMAFMGLGLLELVHSFNLRTSESVFKQNLFGNVYSFFALIIGITLQVIVIAIPFLSKVFDVTLLNAEQWLIIVLTSLLPTIYMELQKKNVRNKNTKNLNLKQFMCKNNLK